MFALIALFGLGSDLHKGVYVLIFSMAVGAGAAAIGITAVIKARRSGSYRPFGSVGGIVIGALAVLISGWVLAVYLTFPTPMTNYVRCISQAQSTAQSSACERQFFRQVQGAGSGTPSVRQVARSR